MKIDTSVLAVLKSMSVDGNIAKMPKQLERKLYVATNKVLECMGGKWNKKLGGHAFDCADAGDKLTDAITMGEIVDAKKEFQFFETPDPLADYMVDTANIRPTDLVLEPSAGKGAIIKAIHRKHPDVSVCAVELNVANAADMAKLGKNVDWAICDFLGFAWVHESFDRIVMNPPFRNGQDIAHVRFAYDLLKPGGRMVAITSPGWTFREDKKHSQFKDWLGQRNAVSEDLPAGTFKSSGTMVNTVMLEINKPPC